MDRGVNYHPRWVSGLRWTARVWSVVSVVLLLGFIIGEGIHLSGPKEWIGFALFPIGISVGMVLAWRHERLGGAITVGSLLAFYVLYFATTGAPPKGWAWLVFAAPGFLFLLSSL